MIEQAKQLAQRLRNAEVVLFSRDADTIDALVAEVERLKAESSEMALIGVRSVADVLELRAEIERLKPWATQPAAQLGAEMGQRVVALEAEVERLREALENVSNMSEEASISRYARSALEVGK